jgi:SRSO17 transposase
MIGRAVKAEVPFAWVAGDEVYGGNPKLRGWLEEQQIRYVMAVACSEMIAVPAGAEQADELAALVPAAGWQRLSCADGSKEPRLYDRALIETASAGHWPLARRSLRPGEKGELELAFFRCWSPRPVTLPELVAVAGARWVEDCFAEAKFVRSLPKGSREMQVSVSAWGCQASWPSPSPEMPMQLPT